MIPTKTALIIPAYNEAANVAPLKQSFYNAGVGIPVILVDDGSTDDTALRAEEVGFQVIRHDRNRGIGPAVQAGIRQALACGAEVILRMDADLQHPAEAIPDLLQQLEDDPDLDLVVASRYLGKPNYTCTPLRRLGTCLLAHSLSLICDRKITDPTSGFFAMRREAAEHFARYYPSAWPEAEALIQLHRHGFKAAECPVPFLPRQRGRSSIRGWKSWVYAGHTLWILGTVPLRHTPYPPA